MSSKKFNPRQTLAAVCAAVAVGIVGGGAIYAATSENGGGPGGFGPPGPPPISRGL